jgi:hypothetical protein
MREVRFRDRRKSATLLSSNFMRHDTKCMYESKIEGRSRNHCCSGKAISILYSECVFVALVTQHAKRMSHIILSPTACMAPPYCPNYLIKAPFSGGGKGTEHNCEF